ncbi:MAG: hypothetical protein V8T86_13455 [Victivallis sp.]
MAERISWSGEFLPENHRGDLASLSGELLTGRCRPTAATCRATRCRGATSPPPTCSRRRLARSSRTSSTCSAANWPQESPELVNWLRATVIERVIDPFGLRTVVVGRG